MIKFEATQEFFNGISEIKALTGIARENEKANKEKYAACNKAALVLLCWKFEKYLENFMDEFVLEIKKVCTSKNVPEGLLEHFIDVILDDVSSVSKDRSKRKLYINRLSALHNDSKPIPIDTYEIRAKFNYWKHGEEEIKKLLRNFWFDKITGSWVCKGFFDKFNSLNALRNNILHQDATPGLSVNDVELHLVRIKFFVRYLNTHANNIMKKALNSQSE